MKESNQIPHKKIYQLAVKPTVRFSIAGKAKQNSSRSASLGSPVLPWPTRFGFTFRKEIPFQKRDLALALALSRPAGGRPRLVRAEAGLVMDDSMGTFRRGLSLQSWRLFLVTFLCG